jgi:hypothetical protein
MNDKPLLSDETVHDRLVAAAEALGTGQAETTRGQTALDAAKRALVILQWGLGPVGIHRECIMAEAMWIMAAKL